MRKLFCYIIVFLFPITLTTMFIRKANNVEEFGSFSIVYDYLQLYPVESIDEIKTLFANWKDLLFENAEFEPDWSGNIWSDLQEIGQLLADGFTFIINFISWQVKFGLNLLEFLWDSLGWIINLPYYVLSS